MVIFNSYVKLPEGNMDPEQNALEDELLNGSSEAVLVSTL